MEFLIDVWEGSLDIDEALIRNAGIVGVITRLNDMNGGHHKDANFDNQWGQSRYFLRAPYFVYNPWVNGKANYDWLMANLPDGVTRLMIDIEVRKTGYSALEYANEVDDFYERLHREYPLAFTYTATWFLSALAHWNNGDYCWARYPYAFYPPQREYWTWEKLFTNAHNYGWEPDPRNTCPGVVKLWQLTADRLIFPGCANRPIDVIAWNGDLASLETWFEASLPEEPMPLSERVRILWREAALKGWNLNG